MACCQSAAGYPVRRSIRVERVSSLTGSHTKFLTDPTAQERAYSWERTIAFHLTEAELGQLLGFLRSDIGQRFILLQRQLQPIENEWHIYSTDRSPWATDIAPTYPDVTPQRNAIMTLALGESPQEGAAPSNVPMISAWAAIHHGSELDRLYLENEAYIGAYQNFSRSPALLKMLQQTSYADWSSTPAGKKWLAAENAWLNASIRANGKTHSQ
jgi:hypothetical protein